MRNNVFADVKEESICAQTPASAKVIYLSFHKPLENPFSFLAQKSVRLKNKWSNTLFQNLSVLYSNSYYKISDFHFLPLHGYGLQTYSIVPSLFSMNVALFLLHLAA